LILCPNNKDIQKENKLDFEIKIKDLYEEYINSEQFQKAVKKLSDEEKSYEYIYNYINTSKDLLSYFKSTDNKKNNYIYLIILLLNKFISNNHFN